MTEEKKEARYRAYVPDS